MRILTRRVGESLKIGSNITVVVVEVNGAQTRIGIVAPKEVRVMRQEIAHKGRPETKRPPEGGL